MSQKLQEELLQQMSRLPKEEQRRVLVFMKEADACRYVGKDLLNFSGETSQEGLQAMTNVIEEGCIGTR